MTIARSLLFLLAVLSLRAQSPWLPRPGQIILTPGYSHQSFTGIWMGSHPANLPASVGQKTGTITAEVGLSSNLAADFTVGYTSTGSAAFGPHSSDSGLTDTTMGLRWKINNERGSRWAPTMTLRAGGIIRGTYQPNRPFSAGDGASGVELSVLLGKAFGETGFGAYSETGYRMRDHNVPEDLFGSAGLYKSLRGATLSVGYRHTQALSGMDIGDPGFTFPRLKEIVQLMEGGFGFSSGPRRYHQFFCAKSVAGRNTGDKLIFGFTTSFSF